MSDMAHSEREMRVRRTFAFIDLSGFTSLVDRKGDDDAVDVLSEFRRIVREVAGHTGVRVAKWLGDGAMLVGVESRPLLDAVMEIERRCDLTQLALPLRAGIAAGDVIIFEGDDYIGRVVNLAARLCDEALPHEVLAPADFAPLLDGGIDTRPVGPRPVRGFSQPIDLVDVGLGQAAAR